MKNINFKKLTKTAKAPVRNHETDAGLDMFTDEEIVLRPQQKALIRTGIAVDIPKGYVGLLTGRSGVSSKTNLVVTLGVIDAGYHGDVSINIKNDEQAPDTNTLFLNQNMKLKNEGEIIYDIKGCKIENNNPFSVARGRNHLIQKGDKLAQLLILPIVTPQLNEVDQFNENTERGTKGFGSSDE